MSNNTPHLVAQPLQYDEDIDLRNDDDLRRTVIHAAQSLSEDEDLSAIAFLQQSGPRDLMLFTPKHGDIGTLADAFDLRGALEDIITMLRKGNRVIMTKVNGKDGWSLSRVAGDYNRASTIDGVPLDKYTPRPNVKVLPHCGHLPSKYMVWENIRLDDGPDKLGNAICMLCDNCARVYGTNTPEEQELAKAIGNDALVESFIFVPTEDLEKLPHSTTPKGGNA